MRKNLKTYQIILLALAFVALAYLLTLFVSDKKFDLAKQNLKAQITEQQTLLVSVSEMTARNGTDSITDSILRDCVTAERTEFDTLLSKLDKGLPSDDLYKVERLFGRCGTFYSEKKALLSARLSREVQFYATLVAQLDVLNQYAKVSEYQVEEWTTVASLENDQSILFTDLVSLQNQIIQALVADNAPDSPKMKEILARVKTTQDALADTNNQVAKVQTTVNP